MLTAHAVAGEDAKVYRRGGTYGGGTRPCFYDETEYGMRITICKSASLQQQKSKFAENGTVAHYPADDETVLEYGADDPRINSVAFNSRQTSWHSEASGSLLWILRPFCSICE